MTYRWLYLLLFTAIAACAASPATPVPFEGETFSPIFSNIEKIEGVSFVGHSNAIEAGQMNPAKQVGAEWISLMPYAYSKQPEDGLYFENSTWQWWGESYEGNKKSIEMAHDQGLKVLLKPHVWMMHGVYTGHFSAGDNTELWKHWESNYSDYILTYAGLAQEKQVDMLCIATELDRWVQERPAYWKDLILRIREVYDGPLTYAANWDAYNKMDFWSELDYIGVDAYFPLASNATTPLDSIRHNWIRWKGDLNTIAKQYNKPVLFTEYGYRSKPDAAVQPWDSQRGGDEDMQMQADLTKILFEETWNEPWMAGGFVWKWFANHETSGGKGNNRFTPQNKPAETIIAKQYNADSSKD